MMKDETGEPAPEFDKIDGGMNEENGMREYQGDICMDVVDRTVVSTAITVTESTTFTLSTTSFNDIKNSTSTVTKELIIDSLENVAPNEDATILGSRVNLKRSEPELVVARESNNTKKKLKQIEAELALMREIKSTRTREKLKQAETELSRIRKSNSNGTRDRLRRAEEKLAKRNAILKKNYSDNQVGFIPFQTAEDETVIVQADSRQQKKDKRHARKSLRAEDRFHKKQEFLREKLKQDVKVDLAFLVNCEIDIDAYLEATKHDVEYIIKYLIEKYESRIRLAFVGCLHHNDGETIIKCLSFTEDIQKFKNFVNDIHAPEEAHAYLDNVFGGLKTALNLMWSSKNRIIFHIGEEDLRHITHNAPDGYANTAKLTQFHGLIEGIESMNIKYFCGSINNSASNITQEPSNVKLTSISTPDDLKMVVIDSVSSTIDDNIYKTMSDFKTIRDIDDINNVGAIEINNLITLKEYSVTESKNQINENESDYIVAKTMEEVQWLEFNIPAMSQLSEIKHHISAINYKWTDAIIEKASDPFCEGNERISYNGSMIFDSSYQRIVVKEFKHNSEGDRKKDYIKIMETQAVTAIMAYEFNKVAPPGAKEIQCNHVSNVFYFIHIHIHIHIQPKINLVLDQLIQYQIS